MTDTMSVGLFYLCISIGAIILLVLMVCIFDVWFGKRIRQCENCGIDLPYGSTDSMCTVCSVGYRDDLILPDQEVVVDGDELIDVCQHTLSKLSID